MNNIENKPILGSTFEKLNNINVSDKIEKKNGLNYLSWAYAWREIKKVCPAAEYKIYETTNPQGYVCNYFTDGKTCWVKTSVIIDGIEYIDELPVMNNMNKSIKLQDVTSFEVNKTIQRSLTKAMARHGLGLALYTGEDLPEEVPQDDPEAINKLISAGIENLDKVRAWSSQHKYGNVITMDLANKIINIKNKEEE